MMLSVAFGYFFFLIILLIIVLNENLVDSFVLLCSCI